MSRKTKTGTATLLNESDAVEAISAELTKHNAQHEANISFCAETQEAEVTIVRKWRLIDGEMGAEWTSPGSDYIFLGYSVFVTHTISEETQVEVSDFLEEDEIHIHSLSFNLSDFSVSEGVQLLMSKVEAYESEIATQLDNMIHSALQNTKNEDFDEHMLSIQSALTTATPQAIWEYLENYADTTFDSISILSNAGLKYKRANPQNPTFAVFRYDQGPFTLCATGTFAELVAELGDDHPAISMIAKLLTEAA